MRENEERDLLDRARKVSRTKIIEALESCGIQCYDHESNETLERALVQNILDGNLTEDSLDGY